MASETVDKEEGDSGIDANSQGSCSSSDVKAKDRRKDKKKKTNARTNAATNLKSEKENNPPETPINNRVPQSSTPNSRFSEERPVDRRSAVPPTASSTTTTATTTVTASSRSSVQERQDRKLKSESKPSSTNANHMVFEASSRHPAEREDFEATGNETYTPVSKAKKVSQL